MNIHHLFIIGNGFDRGAHSMPTGYNNFRNYLIDRFPGSDKKRYGVPYKITFPDGSEGYDPKEIAGYIISIIDNCGDEKWSELENDLGDSALISTLDDLKEVSADGSDKDMWNDASDNESISSNIRDVFKYIKEYFGDWIMDYYSSFDYGYCGLFKDLKNSLLYKPDIAKVLLEADGILTFNYTLTLEKVYGISPEIICHIHGKVEDSKENIYFGHGDDEDFPEEFQYTGAGIQLNELKRVLRKDTQKAYYKHKSFFERISDKLEDIHTFGFSFSDVDLYYLQRIAKRVDVSKVTIYINKFDDKKRHGEEYANQQFNLQLKKVENLGFNICVDDRW